MESVSSLLLSAAESILVWKSSSAFARDSRVLYLGCAGHLLRRPRSRHRHHCRRSHPAAAIEIAPAAPIKSPPPPLKKSPPPHLVVNPPLVKYGTHQCCALSSSKGSTFLHTLLRNHKSWKALQRSNGLLGLSWARLYQRPETSKTSHLKG